MATPRFLAPLVAIALTACSMQQTPAIPTATAPGPPATIQRNPSGQSASTAAPAWASAPSPSVSLRPDALATAAACDAGGAVRATPCKIDFTPANSGAAAVTLTTPHGAKGSLAEQDDCSTSGVAAISQEAADQWLVTAGLKHGTCTVHFTYTTNGADAERTVLRIANAT